LIIFTIITLYGYNEELDSKISFIKFHKKVLDLKKDGEIFNNLVPEFIQGKMKNSSERNSVDYETVTIVFCDISDFDKLVAKLTAKDMIYLLDKIYGTFDQLCTLHGIQKIETVGKTYMACGGLRECEKDIDTTLLSKHHAIRIFEMAIDMIDIMQSMTLENGDIVRVKIGVHLGKVIPAVVGNHKPQFSLIGDTVNTSARMCSYSKDLCIMCSDDAYEHIGRVYTEFIHSEQMVKGKGSMQLHLYNPIKSKNNIFETKVKNIKESQWLVKSNTLRQQNTLKNNPPILNNLAGKNNEVNNIIELKRDNEKNMKINISHDSGSNRSVFIFEDSLEMPEKADRSQVKKISNDKMTIAKKLSKRMTTLNSGSIIGKQQNTERNFIYHDSYLFLDFKSKAIEENDKNNEQEKEKTLNNLPREVYNRYLKLKFKKKENYTNLIHIIYAICILIGIYNLSSYNYILSYFFIFNVIRFIIVLGVIIALTFAKYLREKMFIYKTLVFFIYLSFTIMIQIQLNLVHQYFYLNLILEQHLTLLITSFNG
jgi:class 3 adenylate cyclase